VSKNKTGEKEVKKRKYLKMRQVDYLKLFFLTNLRKERKKFKNNQVRIPCYMGIKLMHIKVLGYTFVGNYKRRSYMRIF
jgi:hypothetical protein